MLALLAAAVLSPVATVEVARGENGYWFSSDTTLDTQAPDATRGGEGILEGGPGKTILIRFGQLKMAIGRNKRIRSAKLVLTLSGPTQPKLRSIGQVLAPWGDGPARTLSAMLTGGDTPVPAPRWASSWRNRRAGPNAIAWNMAGCAGPADVARITGAAQVSVNQDTIAITGLEKSVQAQYDRWWENNGFALNFENNCEFFSGDAGFSRPRLVLEVEDLPVPTGPDLSVAYITRTPAYERYDARDADTVKAGVPFPNKVPNSTTRKWPNDGDEMTYSATVRNVGNALSKEFSYQWIVGEQTLTPVARFDGQLDPGASTVIKLARPFKNLHADHRVQPLMLKITPDEADADPDNDAVEINENALSMDVQVAGTVATALRKAGQSPEAWAQEQVRYLNEAFAQSRFSFAPEGALERVRVDRVIEMPDSEILGRTPILGYDVEASVMPDLNAAPSVPNRGFFRQVGLALGLPDLAKMNRVEVRLAENGAPISRRMTDRFPGIMGGGDTRNDSPFPVQLNLSQDGAFEPLQATFKFDAPGLFSATDIASLNTNLGRRRGFRGDVLYDVPQSIGLRFLTPDGMPISKADVLVYQSSDGVIPDGNPIARLVTSDNGATFLAPRPIEEAANLITLTGHVLKPNSFGRIDPDGKNGVLLLKVTSNGATDYAWVRLWQCVDAYYRGNKGTVSFDFRLQLPTSPLDPTRNFATGRPATGSSGADLAALADGKFAAVSVDGDWIDLDLGRDRMAGEIRLFGGPDFWSKFDVVVYQTGEKPEQGRVWAKEVDWAWTQSNRVDLVDGQPSVAYRGRAQRFRFVRLINRSGQPSGKLAEVRVVPVKSEGG